MVDWRCPGIVWRAGRERRTPGVNGRRPLLRRDYFEAMSAHLDTGIFGCKRSGWDWGNGFPNEGPNDSDSISGVGGSTTGSLSWNISIIFCVCYGRYVFFQEILKVNCHVIAFWVSGHLWTGHNCPVVDFGHLSDLEFLTLSYLTVSPFKIDSYILFLFYFEKRKDFLLIFIWN